MLTHRKCSINRSDHLQQWQPLYYPSSASLLCLLGVRQVGCRNKAVVPAFRELTVRLLPVEETDVEGKQLQNNRMSSARGGCHGRATLGVSPSEGGIRVEAEKR